jgi:pimeloyl-ACP methyl ester carboxylesterase
MRPIRWLRRGLTLLTIGAAGAAAAVTIRHLLETPQPLESTLPGEGYIDRGHGGNLYYDSAGDQQKRPIVLLHDFYPGASNDEYRRVFPRFALVGRVYAPDWLGFGMSEHPHVAYTGEFYANMLAGFLRDVVQRPACVIAAGRAANIAVRAASDTPELFECLVLVSPYALAGINLEPTAGQALARAAQRTSLGLVPYALLSTRPALRRLQGVRSSDGDDPMARASTLQHLYASAHQFGGHHALLALLTGELDLPMQNALALMAPPALIVSGGDDPTHPREDMEDLAILSPHTDLEVLPGAGAAVMEDQPAAFVEIVTRWLEQEQAPQVMREARVLPLGDVPTGSPPTDPTAPRIEAATASGAEPLEDAPTDPGVPPTSEIRDDPPSSLPLPDDPAFSTETAAQAQAVATSEPEATATMPPLTVEEETGVVGDSTQAPGAEGLQAQTGTSDRGSASRPRNPGRRNSRPLDRAREHTGDLENGGRRRHDERRHRES